MPLPSSQTREKSSPALDPNYSLPTQDFSAPNGTVNYTGAQEPTFSHPQQGQPGLSPPTLPSGNGESELFIKTAASTLEILLLFGKVTRPMTPTTTSSCPGESQNELAKMGRRKAGCHTSEDWGEETAEQVYKQELKSLEQEETAVTQGGERRLCYDIPPTLGLIPFLLFSYLFMALLGLCCCAQAFSSCDEQGLLPG